NVEDLEHNIIREALKLLNIRKGVEIYYMADIPLGSAGIGLGSSSGLAVGVLNALYAFKGQHVSAERLAQDAYKIEHEILKHPVGKQDQYMTAYGGFNFLCFNRDESVFVDPIICGKETKEKLNKKLLLFYTGITRVSSDILAEQQKGTRDKMDFLNKMVGLTKDLAHSLSRNDLTRFGEILHEGWMYKKELASGVSNFAIDGYYEKARRAGALGGKVLGAGGGGFLVLYCEEEHHDNVRKSLADLKECDFSFEPQGSKIIYVSD
ncbi:MAG: GHMP kinase, partial [Deltaproteobacteria bacterium]|nr:GHMP kinase [Deltaproteobacteria bacterium]